MGVQCKGNPHEMMHQNIPSLELKHEQTYCWWFRNPAPVEVGSFSHDLQGFIHPRWCRISSIDLISSELVFSSQWCSGFPVWWDISMDMDSFLGGGPTFSSKTKSHWFEVHWTMATVFETWPRSVWIGRWLWHPESAPRVYWLTQQVVRAGTSSGFFLRRNKETFFCPYHPCIYISTWMTGWF